MARRNADFAAGFAAEFDRWANEKVANATEAMRETVELGEEAMNQATLAATTPTGERRAARGAGVAGRVESGNMIESEDHRVEVTIHADGATIRGRVGWLDDVEPYFLEQETGKDQPYEGMRALFHSSVAANEELKRRIHSL